MRRIFTRKGRSQIDQSDDLPDYHFGSAAPEPAEFGSFKSKSNSSSSKHNTPPRKNARPNTLETLPDRLEPTPRRRRRATLPSLVLSDGDNRDALEGSAYPIGLRDRGLGYRSNHSQETIHRPNLLASRRLSRSTDALRSEADHMNSSPWTRQNTENHRPQTSRLAVSDSEVSFRPRTSSTVTSSRASTAPSDGQESIAPNVGHLVNSMQTDGNASLEQRLTTLEVKLIDMEFAIERMQTQSAPSRNKSRRKKSPHSGSRRKHVRKHSSSYLPPVTVTQNGGDPHTTTSPSVSDRPVSTSTVRPSTTTATALHHSAAQPLHIPSTTSLGLGDYNGISVEQYSALVMLLRREQSARRTLEDEVSTLRDDMRHFQRVARDSMGLGTMYPILSKESQEFLGVRSQDRSRSLSTSPSPSPSRFRRTAPYDSDSDWDRSDPSASAEERPTWERNPRIEIAGMI